MDVRAYLLVVSRHAIGVGGGVGGIHEEECGHAECREGRGYRLAGRVSKRICMFEEFKEGNCIPEH